jgi:osmotically-inducible protein OsmY
MKFKKSTLGENMKKLFLFAALGCSTAAFANYQNQQGYNSQPNYQSQGGGYNQSQPYYQSQGSTYYQTQPQTQNYDQNQQYQNQGYSQQPSGMSSGYISQSESAPGMTSGQEMGQTQTKPQDAAATEQDKQINAKIRDKLSNLGIKGFETIILRTQNGIVLISGSVDKVDDITKIKDQVKDVDGVKSVNNQLTAKNR